MEDSENGSLLNRIFSLKSRKFNRVRRLPQPASVSRRTRCTSIKELRIKWLSQDNLGLAGGALRGTRLIFASVEQNQHPLFAPALVSLGLGVPHLVLVLDNRRDLFRENALQHIQQPPGIERG